jgi:hypothetical protein
MVMVVRPLHTRCKEDWTASQANQNNMQVKQGEEARTGPFGVCIKGAGGLHQPWVSTGTCYQIHSNYFIKKHNSRIFENSTRNGYALLFTT